MQSGPKMPMTDAEHLLQIRRSHASAEPKAANPAWVHTHADLGFVLAQYDLLASQINTPQITDFLEAVRMEASHQRLRWGSAHDAGKAPEDWFWLLGYLSGKAVHAAKSGDTAKALHHTISSAAALMNWHLALSGTHNVMRPGINPVEKGLLD